MRKRFLPLLGLLFFLAMPPLGCKPRETKLLLYCGAGIRPPVAEIAEAFGRRHGVTVECDYAGSEVLLSRIRLSRQGDLYMPGDVHYVEQAREEGCIVSQATACYFVPVILVRKGNPQAIESLDDLTRPGIKLGLGDPDACAIGRKASKIFQKNGIAEEGLDVAFRSMTVNELGTDVALGALDAAIVWDAVAANLGDRTDVVAIPLEENVVSTVSVGLLECSEQAELARQFLDFVTSEEAVGIFKKHGYTVTAPR